VTVPPTLTRFVNNTAYFIHSLKIDGVEQIPVCGVVASGGWLEKAMVAGAHNYTMYNGILDDVCVAMSPSYYFPGTWTQRQGVREVITFTDPTIQAILSVFSSQHEWYADWWDVNTLTNHVNRFVFKPDGTYSFYVDRETSPRGTGSFYQLSRDGPSGSVTFRVVSDPSLDGTLFEFFGWFTMKNGPGGSMLQYFPR